MKRAALHEAAFCPIPPKQKRQLRVGDLVNIGGGAFSAGERANVSQIL
jgi:hypothetical protein